MINLQMTVIPRRFNDMVRRRTRMDSYFKSQSFPKGHFGVFPTLINPSSTGDIKLKSTNRYELLIDPKYLSNPKDVEILREGFKKARQLLSTAAFKELAIEEIKMDHINHPMDSDEYIEELIKTIGTTGYHLVGTCKMGKADDPTSIVNPRLKVHGFKNLRVIDASVMPKIISGNPNGPVIMIAEKGADMIKEDWK